MSTLSAPTPNPQLGSTTQASPRKFNTLAILAPIAAVLAGFIWGLPLGIVALRQIHRTHERGKFLAWLGIVIAILAIGWAVYFWYGARNWTF